MSDPLMSESPVPESQVPEPQGPAPDGSGPEMPGFPPPDRPGFFARVLALLFKPSETFDRIADEPDSVPAIFTGYVAPLAAIGPVCRIIGASVVGLGPFGAGVRVPWVWSILAAVTEYVLDLGVVFLLGFAIFTLAPRFGGRRDVLGAFKLAAYVLTPVYLAGVFNLVPAAGFLVWLGLYGVYLIYAGLPWLMKNQANRSPLYTAAVTICALFMLVIIGAVAGRLTTLGTVHARASEGAPAGLPAAHAVTSSSSSSATAAAIADSRMLVALMPPLFNGAARADTTTASSDGLSVAEATYSVGGGSIHLKVSDAETPAKLAAANASAVPDGGDETVQTDGNRTTRQAFDATGKSGHYMIVLDGRISVEADGSHVDPALLKALASQVSIEKIEGLGK